MKQRFKHADMNKVYHNWINQPKEMVDKIILKTYAGSNRDWAFRVGFNLNKNVFPLNSLLYAIYCAGKEWKKVNIIN